MKKVYLAIIVLLIIAGIYLNRSYSYIYHEIGNADLRSPDSQRTYMITNTSKNPAESVLYAALGDSLSAGMGADSYQQSYPYLVAEKLAAKGSAVTLKDFAVSGAKTDDVIKDQLTEAITNKPNIITLLIGVNDIHGNISKTNFQKNYEQILTQLTKNTSAKVYAISIPYIGSNTLFLPPYQFYFNFKTKEFNGVIKKLAAAYNVKYIDIYTPTINLFTKSGPQYSADLFHPSADGYKLWAEIISKAL